LSRKPRDPKESILNKPFLLKLLLQGGLIALCTMVAFHVGLRSQDAALASTMAFATLTLARLFHGFNCRSKKSIFALGFKRNWYSLGAFGAGALLLAIILFIPILHGVFEVEAVTPAQAGMVVGLAVIPTVIIQIIRILSSLFSKDVVQ